MALLKAPPSSLPTIATFSDGGDMAAMSDYDSRDNMRQNQLQSVATLGHQLLPGV